MTELRILAISDLTLEKQNVNNNRKFPHPLVNNYSTKLLHISKAGQKPFQTFLIMKHALRMKFSFSLTMKKINLLADNLQAKI